MQTMFECMMKQYNNDEKRLLQTLWYNKEESMIPLDTLMHMFPHKSVEYITSLLMHLGKRITYTYGDQMHKTHARVAPVSWVWIKNNVCYYGLSSAYVCAKKH